MSDSKEIDRFSQAVALLKQKIGEVDDALKRASAPRLSELRSTEDIPLDKRGHIEKLLWDIFVYGEYPVAKMWSDLQGNIISVKSTWQFNYYEDTYRPVVLKIQSLIDMSDVPDRKFIEKQLVRTIRNIRQKRDGINDAVSILRSRVDDDMDIYENSAQSGWIYNNIKILKIAIDEISSDITLPKSTLPKSTLPKSTLPKSNTNNIFADDSPSIKDSFRKVVELAEFTIEDWYDDTEEYVYQMEGDVDFDDVEKVIGKAYFNPDAWIANEEDLLPTLITRKMSDIRPPIRQRVREIYDSYVFGNWIAVIALSRCLLEYVIHDVGPSHNIRVYLTDDEVLRMERGKGKRSVRKDKKMRRDLSVVIDDASTIFPTLESGMKKIKNAGNNVMHPASPYKRKNSFADIGNIYVQNQKDAKESLTHIIKITTILYNTPPLKPSPK